jgi:hypothetical protein
MLVLASSSGAIVIGLGIACTLILIVFFLRLERRGEAEEQAERDAAEDPTR